MPVVDDVIAPSIYPRAYLNDTCKRLFEISTAVEFLTPYLKDVKKILEASEFDKKIAKKVLNTIKKFDVVGLMENVKRVLRFMDENVCWFDKTYKSWQTIRKENEELIKSGIEPIATAERYCIQEREVPEVSFTGRVLPKCIADPKKYSFTFYCNQCSYCNTNIDFLNVHFYYEHAKREQLSNLELESSQRERLVALANDLTGLCDNFKYTKPFHKDLEHCDTWSFWSLEGLYNYDMESLARMARENAGIEIGGKNLKGDLIIG